MKKFENDSGGKRSDDAVVDRLLAGDAPESVGRAAEWPALIASVRAEKRVLSKMTDRVTDRVMQRLDSLPAPEPAGSPQYRAWRPGPLTAIAAAAVVTFSAGIFALIAALHGPAGDAVAPSSPGPVALGTGQSSNAQDSLSATGEKVVSLPRTSLAEALDKAAAGGELRLQSGVITGQYTIRKKLRVTSEGGPVIIGQS